MRTPDFYVQLIESPTAAEEAVGITEATLISEYLRLAEIPVTIHRVRTRPEFSQAVAATFSARRPLVLHLSMHATKGGIELDSRFRVRFAAEVRFDRFAEQMREVREAWEKKVAEVLES